MCVCRGMTMLSRKLCGRLPDYAVVALLACIHTLLLQHFIALSPLFQAFDGLMIL